MNMNELMQMQMMMGMMGNQGQKGMMNNPMGMMNNPMGMMNNPMLLMMMMMSSDNKDTEGLFNMGKMMPDMNMGGDISEIKNTLAFSMNTGNIAVKGKDGSYREYNTQDETFYNIGEFVMKLDKMIMGMPVAINSLVKGDLIVSGGTVYAVKSVTPNTLKCVSFSTLKGTNIVREKNLLGFEYITKLIDFSKGFGMMGNPNQMGMGMMGNQNQMGVMCNQNPTQKGNQMEENPEPEEDQNVNDKVEGTDGTEGSNLD